MVCDDKRKFKAHKMVLSACSSVFKSIIDDLPINNDSVIYLKGIHHQDMESILEFMYLGVATFYRERINEFLNVAKNLEVKEISRDVEFDEDVGSEEPRESETSNDMISELPNAAETTTNYTNSKRTISQNVEGMYTCNQCQNQFTRKDNLNTHIQSKHDGIKYACNQCEYQATTQGHLKVHIQSKHDGIKYACNHCEYQASTHSTLKVHIQSKHEGIKYACNKCNQQFKWKHHFNSHVKTKH